MAAKRVLGSAAWLVAALAACTPGPAPKRELPEKHPFPVWEGEVHALGKAAAGGTIECKSCHPVGSVNFNTSSCTGCHEHSADLAAAKHTRVSGYLWESTACFACHPDGRRPGPNASAQSIAVTGLIPTFSGNVIVAVTPLEQSIPMTMNHGSAQVPTLSCVTCHPDAELKRFFPGQFHGALLAAQLPQPTACLDCHASSAPVGFVGPLATLPERDPPSGEMRHDAIVWPDGGPLVTEDCSVCHLSPTASSAAGWKTGASFHAALKDAGSPRPVSCLDCHANARPDGLLEPMPKVVMDHLAPIWLGDCGTCHTGSSWDGGLFHPTFPALPTCVPCHSPGRPDAGAPATPTFATRPFDFGTNVRGLTHGAGQDCAACHTIAQRFDGGGHYPHPSGGLSSTTCVACHTTQRPTAPVGSGFDHATSGTGDCFGCHQATMTFNGLSDWAGGQRYPGRFPIASSDALLQVTSLTLRRSGPNNLIASASSQRVPLYNAMLHTSAELPPALNAGDQPGDMSKCWHCHTSVPGTEVVTSFVDGRLHASIAAFRATPDAGVTSLAQPQRCNDCHGVMRPPGLVQKTVLRPMDHDARFTDAGVMIDGRLVTRASQIECAVCHGVPDAGWGSGAFHTRIPAAAQAAIPDCAVCHYTLMADPQADVISAASPGPAFNMKHRSPQLTTQKCDACHGTALANAMGTPVATAWKPGALHSKVTSQPTACVDCHRPASVLDLPTQSTWTYRGERQWMSHAPAAVTSRDCAFCHSADVATKWSQSTILHRPQVTVTSCSACHGPANGGAANNMPGAVIDTKVTTGASASTGVAGSKVQIDHRDVNVRSRDCSFCHTQVGIADAGSPVAGFEWAQASFHGRFTGANALTLDGSEGRCSNCHLNLKPGPGYPKFDHSGAGAAPGADCSSCHSWPGAGSAGSPTWRLTATASAPPQLNVGGFSIASPPGPSGVTTTQAGVSGLQHPAVAGPCTTCHMQESGGRRAFAYDHALAPATGCSACHEAGSDLVATPWTPGSGMVPASCTRGGGMILAGAGDTRPVGLPSLACSSAASAQSCGTQSCTLNHFYPADCGECHRKPTAVPATTKTGADFANGWRFVHSYGAPIQQQTCCKCHAAPGCRG